MECHCCSPKRREEKLLDRKQNRPGIRDKTSPFPIKQGRLKEKRLEV